MPGPNKGPSHHALDLPEIRDLIIRNIVSSKNDIAACALVSRDFYQTCLPYVWETINLRRFRGHRLEAFCEAFKIKGHLVRNVFLDIMIFHPVYTPFLRDCILPYCANLQRIDLLESKTTFTTVVNYSGHKGRAHFATDRRRRENEWILITEIIRKNPNLRSLRIKSTQKPLAAPVEFWRGLAEVVLELRTLEIVHALIGTNGFDGRDGDAITRYFLAVCDCVEEIHLENVAFASPQYTDDPWTNAAILSPLSRLRKLSYIERLPMGFPSLYRLLQGPRLEELVWNTYGTEFEPIPTQELVAALTERSLPLKKLDLKDETDEYSGQDLATILNSLSRPLLELRLANGESLEFMFEELQRPRLSWPGWSGDDISCDFQEKGVAVSHGSMIQVLDLQGCMMDSWVAQMFLEFCPRLQVFRAPHIDGLLLLEAQRVNFQQRQQDQGLQPQPIRLRHPTSTPITTWVCKELKEFHVKITVAPPDEILSFPDTLMITYQIHRAIFQELSQFTQLERLSVGWQRERDGALVASNLFEGMDFRLASGLDLLAGLTRLREVDLNGTEQHLTVQDIDWIAESFPQMKSPPEGKFAPTFEEHMVLRARFLKWRE
ncbi:hypothetical protein BGZ95_011807 [Linnemannia exigua]|uniref:F-box domain-containing protein n=1 Tax=Linnemannia exigua TaxID=604196 RepID=A0AAD4H5D5_9FUNG|nr:hypothetical protein BGZ95_011807 [Linnemannia exigua]